MFSVAYATDAGLRLIRFYDAVYGLLMTFYLASQQPGNSLAKLGRASMQPIVLLMTCNASVITHVTRPLDYIRCSIHVQVCAKYRPIRLLNQIHKSSQTASGLYVAVSGHRDPMHTSRSDLSINSPPDCLHEFVESFFRISLPVRYCCAMLCKRGLCRHAVSGSGHLPGTFPSPGNSPLPFYMM